MSSKNAVVSTNLKELLSCGSSRRIFNALVTIRKLVSKDKNGVAYVLAAAIIPKVVELLGKEDPESEHTSTADIILSILGNLAMDVHARKAIGQADGIKIVANHFLKSSVGSIQLRSCRVLANMAIDKRNCKVISECDVFPQAIKLLQESSNKDIIAVSCRALRLFGQTSAERKMLIDHGAVLPLSKQLKNEDSQLLTSSLRSLCELSTSGCTASFAQQILDANILEELVKLAENTDTTTSHNALSLLLHLTDIPDVRPSIGAAGGIPLFIRLLKDESQHTNKISVVNALCLCGKEAVNRIKIREHGGLQLFIRSLKDDYYSAVHDRIISGLVCFHYDDDSIDILLENDLVSVLLKHLQRSASFESVPESLEIKTEKMKRQDIKTSLSSSSTAETVISSSSADEKTSASVDVKNVGVHDDLERSEKVLVNESAGAEIQDDKAGCNNHVFSIDSPTYTINTEWTLVSGSASITNRQKVTTSLSPCLSTVQYSPLSNESFVSSPSMSSSLFSPPSSPSSVTSPLNIDMYGPIGSKSYMCSSPPPKFSPLGWSPPDSHGNDVENIWHYSSEEESASPADEDSVSNHGDGQKKEEIKNDDKSLIEMCKGAEKSGLKRSCKDESGPSVDTVRVEELHCDHEGGGVPVDGEISCIWKGKRSISERSPESQKLDLSENIPKKCKTESKKMTILKTSEKNILILLSRISVKTDPSPHLINSPVLSCLLDYLTLASCPQARCIRTLSRLLRNPHCLEPLLRIAAPAFIYKNLLLNDEGVDSSLYELFNRRKSERRSSWSVQSGDTNSFSISYDLDLAKYKLVADPQLTSPSRMDHDFDSESSASAVSSKNNGLDDHVIDVAGTGLSLLKDLSFSAASPFGRGVISHILLRKAEHVQILCSVCLLYLCWSPGMQQNYLISMKVADRMLSVLQFSELGSLFSAVLCGFIFLVKMVDRTSILKHSVTKTSFKSIFSKPGCSSSTCQYSTAQFDLYFATDGQKIGSNRETLIKRSAVFSAMLEGHYTEANQSEISIPCTSHDALLYVVHYLHGCGMNCSVIQQMENEDKERKILVDLSLDVLSLADQYLLTDLSHYMMIVLSSKFLHPETIARILEFSVFHDFRVLCMDSIKELFVSAIPVSQKASIIHSLMNTDKAGTLVETIRQLIEEGTKYP